MRRPPCSTRTYTLLPYTTLFRTLPGRAPSQPSIFVDDHRWRFRPLAAPVQEPTRVNNNAISMFPRTEFEFPACTVGAPMHVLRQFRSTTLGHRRSANRTVSGTKRGQAGEIGRAHV